MYFQKKREVVVVLVVLVISIAGFLLFSDIKGSGITGAIIGIEELYPFDSTTISNGSCMNLVNGEYLLAANVSGNTDCFSIINHSVTLNCQGYAVNYSKTGDGTGINNTGGYDHVIIKNCIIQESVGRTHTTAITFRGVKNATIQDNIIRPRGQHGHGIILESGGGDVAEEITVLNNTIKVRKMAGGTSSGIILNGSPPRNNFLINNNISAQAYSILHLGGNLNTLSYNNSFGAINWSNTNLTTTINLSAINYDLGDTRTIFLENNNVGIADLNTSLQVAFNLNRSARIEIKQLIHKNTPDLLRRLPEAAGGGQVRCDNSTDLTFKCNITYDPTLGILYANVTSFSNYSTEENDPPNVTSFEKVNNTAYPFFRPGQNVSFNVTVKDQGGSSISAVLFQFKNKTNPFNETGVQITAGGKYGANGLGGINLSRLVEGHHLLRIFANDSLNNINNTEMINFTLDASAPLITLNQPQNGETLSGTAHTFNAIFTDTFTSVQSVIFQFSNGTGIAFNKTATDVGFGNIWEIAGGLNTRSLMESQQHTVFFYPNDSVGNLNNSFSITITVDNTPPYVTITNPANWSNFSSQTYNFNVTIRNVSIFLETPFVGESLLDTVIFEFSNGSAPFNRTPINRSGTWNVPLVMTSLSEGQQILKIYANDSENNLNSTQTINFNVDRTAPNITFISPFNGSNFSAKTVGFNVSLFDNITQIQTALLMFSTNATAFNKTLTNNSGNWSTSVNFSAFPEGLHSVVAYINDTAGNLNQTVNITFTIDLTVPNATFLVATNGSNFSSRTQGFNLSIFDNITQIQTALLMFSTNATAFNKTLTNNSGNWSTSVNFSVFPEGLHSAVAYINDTVGNLNQTVNITFTVDLTFPNITINFLNNPVDNSNFSIRSSNRTFNASIFDNVTQVNVVYFWFDNGTGQDFNVTPINQSGQWSVSYNVSTLAEGKQGLRIVANDTVNNVNDSHIINFTIDLTAPLVTFATPSSGATLVGNKSFNVTVQDSLTSIQSVIFQFSNGTTPFNRTASNSSGTWNVSIDTTVITEGALTVTVFANDTVGNINSTQTLALTVDNVADPVPAPGGGGGGGSSSTSTSTSTSAPAAPSEAAAPSAPSTSETASASEAIRAFQSGESSVSITRTGAIAETTYTSVQNYKVTITNNLDKKLVLNGALKEAEQEIILENEDNIVKRLKEELLLQGEVDQAALEKELSILKLLENIEVLQVYKTKLSHILPSSLTGAAVSMPLVPTSKRIEANLLRDLLLNFEELQNIEVDPGETLEKEVRIRRGLRLDWKEPPQIVFSSGGEQVLIKDIETHEELITGTAVDIDPVTKKFDFYIIIPPQSRGGKETFTVEMNINVKKARTLSSLPLKVKLPFFTSAESTIFSELYGPYTVNLERGALLAVQYDASAIQGDYTVIGKVYEKGADLIAENHFEIKQ